MFLKIIEKKLTRDNKRSKKFILASALVLNLFGNLNIFSQPLLISDLNSSHPIYIGSYGGTVKPILNGDG